MENTPYNILVKRKRDRKGFGEEYEQYSSIERQSICREEAELENMDGQSEKIFSGKQRNDHSRTSLYEW